MLGIEENCQKVTQLWMNTTKRKKKRKTYKKKMNDSKIIKKKEMKDSIRKIL